RFLVPTAHGKYLDFSLDGGIVEPQIKASPTQRVTQAAFLVRTQYNKRNRFCLDCSQLRNCDLPRTQNFEKQRLEGVVNLVEFVDQQHAGLRLASKRAQQRTFC